MIEKEEADEIEDTLGLEITESITSDDYLRHFIKFNQSVIQEREDSAATTQRTKLKVVFKHVGTELSTQKRVTSEETYARNNDFETPNDVRNNDFETPNDVNFDANNIE